jgi:hypothetical protein
MSLVTSLNPYWLYIKIAAIAIIVIVLFSLGIWIKGVFAERDKLRISEAQAKATTEMYAKAANDNVKLQEGIANAIKNIRIQSDTYIEGVDNGKVPAYVDGTTIQLIAGGMPKAVPSLPTFSNSSTSRTATNAPPR